MQSSREEVHGAIVNGDFQSESFWVSTENSKSLVRNDDIDLIDDFQSSHFATRGHQVVEGD